MVRSVEGFKLEVSIVDLLPHVRVSLKDGTVVVDTNEVSLIGLEKLPAVFETAASMASEQMEAAYIHERAAKA